MPSWPSTMSLPSPGSHWKTSSPAPRRATSLPWLPSTKSLPSPPSSRSMPLPPRIVSLPEPPSTVSLIKRSEVAGGGEAVVAAVGVDDQVLGGADVDRERCRVDPVEPDAGAVGRGRELLGTVATVDLHGVDAGTAFVEVGVVARVPDHLVIATLAEDLVVGVTASEGVVLAPAEQEVEPAADRAVCRCQPDRTAGHRPSRRSACRGRCCRTSSPAAARRWSRSA